MDPSEDDTESPPRSSDGHGTAEPVDDGPADDIDLEYLANVAMDRIAEQAIIHPFRTLGIAAGVGYVLGRGVPTVLVRMGMVAAARVASNAIIGASLEQLGASMRADDSAVQRRARSAGRSRDGKRRQKAGRFGGRRTSGAEEPERD